MMRTCKQKAKGRALSCFLGIVLFFGGTSASLQAQERLSYFRNSTGFWLGSLAPFPNTSLSPFLNTNLGLGLMYRRQLAELSFIETTLSWTYLDSDLETGARIIPWTLAYAHLFPLRTRISIFLKTGIGSTFVDITPFPAEGFIPTLFLGLELAVRATPKLNVGIRFDYYFLYESNLAAPTQTRNPISLPPGTDPRFGSPQSFIRRNSHFGGINLFFGFNH